MTRGELVENVRLAHLALAEFDLTEAETEYARAGGSCKCDPDTKFWDPACEVAYWSDHVDRARAEVRRWQPIVQPDANHARDCKCSGCYIPRV